MGLPYQILTALRLTLQDQILEIAGSLIQNLARPVIQRSLPPRSRPGRMLTHRFLSEKAIDGAILSGIVPDNAWAKYTLPKGLPKYGQRSLAIENEAHTIDDFSGRIENGYGKGVKTLLCSDVGIVKIGARSFPARFNLHFHEADIAGPHFDLVAEGVSPGTRKWEIHIPRGDFKGRYAFNQTSKGIIVVPMLDEGLIHAKPKYALKHEDFFSKIDSNPSDWVVEQKIDGSLGNAVIKDNRVVFRSHRDTGQTYYDRLPQLEDIGNHSRLATCRTLFKGPHQSKTVLQGELYHPDGAARMGGILNSFPDKARAIQATRGPAQFYAWDILKLRGKSVSELSQADRRALLEEVIQDIRRFNKNWHVVLRKPDWLPAKEFYEGVVSYDLPFGEGIVIKDAHQAHGEGTWFKIKQTDFEDFEVVGILPGKGKYADSVGKFEVRLPGGTEVGEVGSFSITDQQRDWIWEHRDQLVGSIAKVRVQETTNRLVPRAGVFVSWHEGKGPTEAGLLMYSETLAGGDPEEAMRTKYALISSAGWNRK
jgi:hypothetical protein